MFVAAVGFLLSVTAHVLSLFGVQIPGGNAVAGLHLGIFVVWIPAVLISARAARFANRWDALKLALAGCPRWMRYGLIALFAYAVVNFILFMGNAPNQTHSESGWPPSVVRGFSGHWMVFYAAAFAILYSRFRAPWLFVPVMCPNGHGVSQTARFCPECGSALPESGENAQPAFKRTRRE
jgi:hypothetical protein